MVYSISNTGLTAVINSKGAELISLKSNLTGNEYIWNGNPGFWAKHSPILFPIVGTLKNGFYNHKNQQYHLSRHGFARDMEFELISKSANEAVFSLKSSEETQHLYPFDFELRLIYTLKESELKIEYSVINTGSKDMYYSIGGHPALALPNRFEDYSLLFEPNEDLLSHQLENDLLSDTSFQIKLESGRLPLTYSLFEKDALIFKELKSCKIQLLENDKPILDFKFNGFPNFGIWTKIGAPFICLEPWAGYSDVVNASGKLNEKEGIQTLGANASKRHSFSFEIL